MAQRCCQKRITSRIASISSSEIMAGTPPKQRSPMTPGVVINRGFADKSARQLTFQAKGLSPRAMSPAVGRDGLQVLARRARQDCGHSTDEAGIRGISVGA